MKSTLKGAMIPIHTQNMKIELSRVLLSINLQTLNWYQTIKTTIQQTNRNDDKSERLYHDELRKICKKLKLIDKQKKEIQKTQKEDRQKEKE